MAKRVRKAPTKSKPKAKSAAKAKPGARSKPAAKQAPQLSKTDTIIAALNTPKGATIPDLMELTGWQAHSLRGVIAGALKKRGLQISSTKLGAERFYKIERNV